MSLSQLRSCYAALNLSGVFQDQFLTDRAWYEWGRKAVKQCPQDAAHKPVVVTAQNLSRVFFGSGRLALQLQRAIAPFPLPCLQGGAALFALAAPYLGAGRLQPYVVDLQGALVKSALGAFGERAAQGGLALMFACQTESFLGRGQNISTSLGPTQSTGKHGLHGSGWQVLSRQLLASPHGTEAQSHDGLVGKLLEVPLLDLANWSEQRGHRSLAAVWLGMACGVRAALMGPRLASCAVVLVYAGLCASLGVVVYYCLWGAQAGLACEPFKRVGFVAKATQKIFAAADALIAEMLTREEDVQSPLGSTYASSQRAASQQPPTPRRTAMKTSSGKAALIKHKSAPNLRTGTKPQSPAFAPRPAEQTHAEWSKALPSTRGRERVKSAPNKELAMESWPRRERSNTLRPSLMLTQIWGADDYKRKLIASPLSSSPRISEITQDLIGNDDNSGDETL